MKTKTYLIIYLFFLFSLTINAQLMAQEVDTTYSFKMRKIFNSLNKNSVPYGLLKEVSLEQSSLFTYRGNILADSNLVDSQIWYEIYSTLAMSKIVNTEAATLKHPQLVDSIWHSKRQPGQITVAGLFYGYGKFKENAKSLLTVSYGVLQHRIINHMVITPFTSDKSIAFASGNQVYYGLNFNLLLPEELWLSNLKGSVSKIQVDANDGLGYRDIIPNVHLPVHYADSGIKELKFRVSQGLLGFSYSHTKIHVKLSQYFYVNDDNQVPIPEFKKNIQSFLPPACITGNSNPEMLMMGSTELFEDLQSVGLITIVYSKPDHKIHKPLIVVEGFDVGIHINPEDARGVQTIEGFVNSIPSNSSLSNLITSDYDLIYVDWKYGTADLRFNALLLKTLIRCINQVKVTNGLGEKEKNVILGQSMGGVVARYALKKMEDDGEDHQTSLFISHDAPHQGANVPLGLQAMAINLQKIAAKATIGLAIYSLFSGPKYKLLLLNHTPAAKQLLSNWINKNYEIDNTVFNSFQSELQALGYPQNCRNISISNGSECGTPFPLAPGSNLFYLNGNMYPGAIADIFGYILTPFAILATGQLKLSLGIIPGFSAFSWHFQTNTVADGGGNITYLSQIDYFKMIAYLLPVQVSLSKKTYKSPLNILPLDCLPGGYYALDEYEEEYNSNNLKYKYGVKPGFSFISTPSALDIGSGTASLIKTDYYKPYYSDLPPQSPKNSPFQNFITGFSSGKNEVHTAFTTRNSNWVVSELNGSGQAQPNCSELCSLELTGTADCLKSGAIYQISNIPAGSSVKWSTAWPAVIVGPDNTSNVTINSLGVGIATLNVTVKTLNCTSSLTKKLSNISPFPPSIDYVNIDPFPLSWTCQFWVTNYLPGYIYKWYVNGILVGSSSASSFQYKFPCGNLLTSVKCVRTTDCASSGFGNTIYFYPPACPFYVFPNPAGSELKVSLNANTEEQGSAALNPAPFELTLYTEKGKKMLSKKSKNQDKELILDTQNLPNGIYYLHIQQGNELIKKQVIIQHE